MSRANKKFPINIAMTRLNINAADLSRDSGVDRTLISRWENGRRRPSRRSTQLLPVAEALLRLDTAHLLDDLIDPYRQRGESDADAICEYLVSGEYPTVVPRADPPVRQTKGSYEVRYQVHLGQKGFYKVALANAEHLANVPPGMELAALCLGSYEWFTGSIPFLLQFLAGVRKAVRRGGRFLVIIRKGYTATETALFAGPWLVFHLRGYIRSRYYDGELPEGLRFAASIPGYLGTWIEEDAEVEDSLYAELHTDPRSMRRSEEIVAEYRVRSRPSSQYGFFRRPQGDGDNPRLWKEGPLPAWERGEQPTGCFHTLCRVPGFGVMTQAEFREVLGEDVAPPVPEYLFRESADFAPGPHRVILCREDVRDALAKQRRRHDALSALLGRRVFVPKQMLAGQLTRLLDAMRERKDFQVALMPRVAFEKLQLEMVCWKDSVSVAWLQDMSESVFADEAPTSGSFHAFLDVVWDKMLAGWRDQGRVSRRLRGWLAGKDLQKPEEVSAIVKNWNVLPEDE